MSEHHGLDLEALFKSSHSIFAPSSAAGWLICEDYILANINEPDSAGVDAAYGTVGHEVAEHWLLAIDDMRDGLEPITEEMIAEARPTHLVGTTRLVQEKNDAFRILIDEEMLAFVAQYILWCVHLPGAHYIEQRVDFSRLTPIPNQKGTADHAACEPGVLTVTDLKMGISPANIVFAAEDDTDPRALVDGRFNGNPQAMIYALGFFFKYDEDYDFEKIVIRIAQPRLDRFHVWETTREELLKFADYVKERAHAAWKKERTRTPSKKGCRWCKVKATCTAYLAFMTHLATVDTDDVFDAVEDAVYGADDLIEGEFTVVTRQEMVDAKIKLDSDSFELSVPDAAVLSTVQLAKLYGMRKPIEGFFEAVYEELNRRAVYGEEIPGMKLVLGREGNREFHGEDSPEWLLEQLDFIGLEGDERFKTQIISPTQAEATLRAKYGLKAKDAARLLSHLIYRKPGRSTLVPSSDKREALPDVGEVFDPVEDEEDTL